jgi:hypothetical protein
MPARSAILLDGLLGQDHVPPLPAGSRDRRRRFSRHGEAEVPVMQRAHRGGWRQRWLAGCAAVLLASAPFAQPSPTLDLGTLAAAESIAAFDEAAAASQPSPALRPAPPASLAILSRQSALESALGLPPLKPPVMRPRAPWPPLAISRAAPAVDGAIGHAFHRSSVGTARTPTGPPS